MIEYVLCVAQRLPSPVPIANDAPFVLVCKARPAWQAGKLNFPGGKVEAGEQYAEAASREFLEETGVSIKPGVWVRRGTFGREGDYIVHVFYVQALEVMHAITTTDEGVIHMARGNFQYAKILGPAPLHNVFWIADLCTDPEAPFFEVWYA
jgi:8-oxo-dGTP pyrophosphatase MutT (NUDIX family)